MCALYKARDVGAVSGYYNVTVDGAPVLFGEPPSFQFDGTMLSPASGNLKLVSSAASSGADGFGKYGAGFHQFPWATVS